MSDEIWKNACAESRDAELTNLKADVVRLRAALFPFAEIAELEESEQESSDEWQDLYDFETIAEHCRNAVRALEETKP